MAQYFGLTLDTTAHNGIISGVGAYYNSNATVTLSADGASFMKVWTNSSASGSTSDTECPANWETYKTSKQVSFATQGTNYVHAIFMDDVGNIGDVANSSATCYDTVAPTITAVSINDGAEYTSHAANNTIRVTASDATSGIANLTLSGPSTPTGDITWTSADTTAGYKDITITLTGEDGTKTISVTATDVAGNTSAASTDSIFLDTHPASGTLILRQVGDTGLFPTYANTYDYAAAIESPDDDIIEYKLWEGATEPGSWSNWSGTVSQGTNRMLVDNLEFSTGEGQKVVHAKIKDRAGVETTLTVVTVFIDTTAPVVSLSASPTVISAETGFNSTTFTLGATDTYAAQGLNYVLKVDGTQIKAGTLSIDGTTGSGTVTCTEAEIVALSSGEGVKSFTLEVTDAATNKGTSSAQTVTVDLTAPTGSITVPQYSTSTTFNATITGSDTGGATLDYMKAYADSSVPSTWDTFASGTKSFTLTEGAHILHLQLKDSVDNASSVINSSKIIVDTHAPVTTLSGDTYVKTTAYTLGITSTDTQSGVDEVSGVYQMKVWEDGQTEPEWEAAAASKNITLTAVDGQKTINVVVKDRAGNVANAVTKTVYLDQTEPSPTFTLHDADNHDAVLPYKVNVTGFSIRLASTDPDWQSPATYHFSSSVATDELPADGTLTYDTGKQYQSFTDLDLDGTVKGARTITVTLTDAAGNVGTASQSVFYDDTPPEITVNAPDYNKISKQHTLRRATSDASEITGKYNDTVIFTWSASELLAEYKVCVNAPEQTAAGATAIPTTAGSQNMSGTNIAGQTEVTSTIIGGDLETAVGGAGHDGAYEIIVYGKDEAGTWSAVHAINA